MPIDILAIGEPMIELNQTMPGGPYYPGFGGDTSNAIIAAARCGARTAYFTAIGDDVFGQALIDLWRAETVDCGRVIVDPEAATGLYFVTHSEAGHAFSYIRKGSAASRLTPAALPAGLVEEARVLHVSGISQAISAGAADTVFAAIDKAAGAGRMISYDTNLRLKLWPLARARAVTHEAMRRATIALPGLEDACLLTGREDPDAIADFYLGLGPRVVALTLGARGSLIATPDRRETIAALPVKAVDATGAGDVFDGAFLAEYLASGDPFRAGRHANAAAALSTLGYGAVAPMPTRAAIEAVLSSLPHRDAERHP